LQDAAFAAQRVPCSGSAGGAFAGDVTLPLLGVDRIAEVKVRANGFGRLYDWLANRDFLVLKSDRREFLCVLPLRTALEIARVAESKK
jgi:hypothetical protein